MPSKDKLKLVLGNDVDDLKKVRVPGLDKPFEQLTIGELVQLRPGGDVADSYEVNAVTDNVSVTTSSILAELGKVRAVEAMQNAVVAEKTINLQERLKLPIVKGQ